MLISTRGTYALRVLIDLAQHDGDNYIPMKEIAERQGISLKYLEQIVPALSKNGFIKGVHGKGGGYRLVKDPEECCIGDVLRLTEGDLAPVSCLEHGEDCGKSCNCSTSPLWSDFNKVVNNYFDGITLSDLMKEEVKE